MIYTPFLCPRKSKLAKYDWVYMTDLLYTVLHLIDQGVETTHQTSGCKLISTEISQLTIQKVSSSSTPNGTPSSKAIKCLHNCKDMSSFKFRYLLKFNAKFNCLGFQYF